MKVAIVTQFPADPDRPVGGVESVSVNLVRELACQTDLDVEVVTLCNDAASGDTDKNVVFDRVRVHRLPRPAGSELLVAMGSGRRLVQSCLQSLNADLIHAHDTYGIMVQGLALPRVFTVHGFIYGDTLVSNSRFAWIRSKIWRHVETRAWADQPHVISISPYVRERVSRYSEANIRDIDNPVGTTFFAQPRKPQEGRIFSAAVISQRKNTLTLVQAAHELLQAGKDVELRLAGPVVEPAYGDAVTAYIRQHDLEKNVMLLGNLDTEQVIAELMAAQVFALVSLEENSPMGIEEAMAMGVAVVSSNRCGMPYMIAHGESGYLVDPLQPQSVAQGLQRAMESPEHAHTLGDAGRAIAEKRFHPQVVAMKTRAFYDEVVGGAAG